MLPNGDVATSNIGEIGDDHCFFDAIDETIALTDNGTTLSATAGQRAPATSPS